MTVVLIVLAVLIVVAWAIAVFHLRGENLLSFDQPSGQSFATGAGLNAEHEAIAQSLQLFSGPMQKAPRKERIALMREYMDNFSEGREIVSSISAVTIDGLAAEWVVAPNVDSARRVLYIHGGAFVMGSPKSHRVITSKFSEVANAAVLAIDYRLMPENRRIAGIEDCRKAYRWILDNGPEDKQTAAKVFVAGDSAGGNLTLSLIAWVRDQGLRAPDAAIALSPLTDSTLSGRSMKDNVASDVMLGPQFGKLAKVPQPILLWSNWLGARIKPNDPVVSPIHGDLSNLPPLLLHASEAEMLLDDSRRYANKAVAAGSPVRLQTWAHVAHVWHLFDPDLTEAREAFEEIRKFIAEQDQAA